MTETPIETATTAATAVKRKRPNRGGSRRLRPETLKALHAEWHKFSANLSSDLPERELRLQWANERLHARARQGHWKTVAGRRVFIEESAALRSIGSWSQLTEGEARHLLSLMREESGDGPAYRALLIGRLAQELWGSTWDMHLADRLNARFHVHQAADLSPRDAHASIEELVRRIADRDGCGMEDVRARLRR